MTTNDSLATTLDTDTSTLRRPAGACWGFWATVLFGAGIAIVAGVVQVVGATLAFKLSRPGFSWRDIASVSQAIGYDGLALSVALVANAIVGCALIVGAIRLKRGSDWREYLALRTVPPRTYGLWIAGYAAFLVACDLLSLALGKPIVPEVMRTIQASGDPVWLFLIATVVAAPVFEEVFFRGFLLTGLAASPLGDKGAIVATTALWTVIHTQYDPYYLTLVFAGGLILGAARLVTGSLWVPIALHAFCNLGAFFETALLGS